MIRIAYLPLVTYPDIVPDESVTAAVTLAQNLGCDLHVMAFATDMPRVSSPLGNMLLNIPDMIRTAKENSQAQCRRLQDLVRTLAQPATRVEFASREPMPGLTGTDAALEARYFDVSLLPWSKDRATLQDIAQSVVFGAGRPAILVPATITAKPLAHVAIAWDGSRVAARALADALGLVGADTRITVLTVQDEKALDRADLAAALVNILVKQGRTAQALNVQLQGRPIGQALQEAALAAGADMLVMGGFGHSRIRDFILGGATKGVMADLHLPVLLSH